MCSPWLPPPSSSCSHSFSLEFPSSPLTLGAGGFSCGWALKQHIKAGNCVDMRALIPRRDFLPLAVAVMDEVH